VRLTTHARERWQQRCSHLDLYNELAGARRAGKRLLNKLRRGWERAQGQGTWPTNRQYLVTPSGIVFIVCEGSIITVVTIKDIKLWDHRAERDDRLRRRHALV
jgi:hypothetical protein